MDLLSNIIFLFAGVGIFMLAIHMTSESMEKIASDKLRKLLDKISGNKLSGVGIGAGVTAIIQSSSATTVMVVGMVNAGIMTLSQATNIIMGANIGTTITGLIAALPTLSAGSDFPSPTDLLMLLSFIGVIMNMVCKKDRLKTWGNFLAGFGAVFVGLKCMSMSMEFMAELPEFRNALIAVTNPLLLLLIGAVFTGIIQSSAAVTGILITMASNGLIIGGGGNAMLYVVLGTNIGTCVTAVIASIGGATNGKRASLIHLMFNILGSVVFFIIMSVWTGFYDDVLSKLLGGNHGLAIAVFHVVFNLVSTAILLPFSNVLVKIAQKLVKSKPEKAKFKLAFIEDRILKTPSIAMDQLLKETKRLAELARRILTTAVQAFLEADVSKEGVVKEEMEEISFIVGEINKFLVKVNAVDLSSRDKLAASNLHHVISDFERVADLSTNIMRYTVSARERNLYFTEAIQSEVQGMFGCIDEMFELVIGDIAKRSGENRDAINQLEDKVDEYRTQNLENHIERMNRGECNPDSGGIYMNTINNLERAADHLKFISDKEL